MQWKVSVWTVMMLSVLVLLMKTTIASAEAVADAFPLASAVQSELYIVLVSIPVLDKVLPLKNLAEELLHRGYRVGFALPENCWHWVSDLEHHEFISLGNIVGKGRATYSDHQELQTLGVYESYATTLRYYASFQRPMFNALVEDLEEDRPDLLVVDRYTFAGFDAAQRLDIPFVVNNPSLLTDIDSPPAYVGAPFSNISMHTPSAWERCLNSFYRLRFRLAMVQVFKEVNQNRRDQQLPPVESKEELYGGTLVLTNSMFGLDEPRPIAPQFQMIGMLQSPHHRPTPPLPIDFEYWLATNPLNKPVIFISFPSNIPLAPEFVTTLMDGLDNIGARVVWRITLQEQAAFDLRSRSRASVFFLGDDVDETLVLEQTPVSLLITAGDLHTMQQALVVGVPILGVSFSAEQWEAVNAIVRAGAGLHVMSKTFSETTVREATDQLLHKPSYSVAAFHLGELLKTGGGTQRAADHVVSVAQFGASHVLPARNLQPLYKTYLVDVYFIYGVILCGAAVILRTCFAVLYSIFQIAPDVHLGVTLDPPDEPVTEPREKSL
ncbi:hypothetical protein Poli38472_010468 [Pythium oligandrum]|uniref:Uncharacterized protein n=1 Tax=Pythium oligandrum TaxID=41045 RepID=A0A8K1C351_PYTOL|nr:hypothetical protein Poli38472_010468 [Pythium oligandrum]|eukprot:TMW55586.1 hypothetical protein Poli38472_010468 [Pythium oligandrum]